MAAGKPTLLTGLALLAIGCASAPPHLDGTAGPVAWRIADLRVVTREVNGRPAQFYVATLVLKELRGSSITFTRYEKTVSDLPIAHGGSSLVWTDRWVSRWVLSANGEWTLLLTSSVACRPFSPKYCPPLVTSAPRFAILLQGTNAQDEPVEVSIQVTLPPAQLRMRYDGW